MQVIHLPVGASSKTDEKGLHDIDCGASHGAIVNILQGNLVQFQYLAPRDSYPINSVQFPAIRNDTNVGAMAKELDIRRFFMRAPHKWLHRYFDTRQVLNGIDWDAVSVRKVDPIALAFSGLPEDVQSEMINDFRDIALLSTTLGKVQLIDEAGFWGEAEGLGEIFEDLEDPGACAFWTFFEKPKVWKGAVFLANADDKPKRPWKTRINMPVLGCLPTHEDGAHLATAISKLFMHSEGRGKYCAMHQIRRGDLEYYFAYPQSHRKTAIEYERDGELTKRPHNPAFEIIFVHDDANRTLSIWHDGSMDRVRELQVAFANSVLGKSIDRRSPKDDRVYDLSHFENRDLTLNVSSVLGIERITVCKLRLDIKGPNPHKVSIKLEQGCAPSVLYDRLDDLSAKIPKSLRQISQVGFQVNFELEQGETKKRTKYFEITEPNSCSLSMKGRDQLIRRFLADNRIEPGRPVSRSLDGDPAP